jgi:predicted permease
LVHLLEMDPGFNPRGTLTFDLSFPDAKYPKGADRLRFVHSVKERLEGLPGIESVGACSSLPLSNVNQTEFASRGDRPPRMDYIVGCNFISADYFSAMGMRLQRGRPISASDGEAGAPRVLVVDETLSRYLYPGEDPIGKNLNLLGQNWEIVGVVAPVHHFAMDRAPQAIVYGAESFSPGFASIAIRTSLPPLALTETVRNEILKLDPAQPIANVRTLDRAVHQSLSSKRAITILLGLFAAVAIGLACVGVYGVTAHAVGQRARELSIRSALGAQRSDIIQLVLKGGMKPSLAGIAVGLLAAVAMGRLIQSQLFEVRAYDLFVFVAAIGLLVCVAALSVYVPARRAAAAAPSKALRDE